MDCDQKKKEGNTPTHPTPTYLHQEAETHGKYDLQVRQVRETGVEVEHKHSWPEWHPDQQVGM